MVGLIHEVPVVISIWPEGIEILGKAGKFRLDAANRVLNRFIRDALHTDRLGLTYALDHAELTVAPKRFEIHHQIAGRHTSNPPSGGNDRPSAVVLPVLTAIFR
jgi:hypothetical protein